MFYLVLLVENCVRKEIGSISGGKGREYHEAKQRDRMRFSHTQQDNIIANIFLYVKKFTMKRREARAQIANILFAVPFISPLTLSMVRRLSVEGKM